MEWFIEFWDTLSGAEQVLYCIAVPATLILLIQTVMLICGFGHGGEGVNYSDTGGIDFGDGSLGDGSLGDGSADLSGDISDLSDIHGGQGDISSGDGSNPADLGAMHLFTIQGVIAFLCIFGWSSIIFVRVGFSLLPAIAIGLILGFAAMFGVAKIIQLSAKLTQNGSFNNNNLLGETGSVYLTIPPSCTGQGKITVNVGERFLEFAAMTDEKEAIPDHTPVRVIDIRGGDIAIVEKIDS